MDDSESCLLPIAIVLSIVNLQSMYFLKILLLYTFLKKVDTILKLSALIVFAHPLKVTPAKQLQLTNLGKLDAPPPFQNYFICNRILYTCFLIQLQANDKYENVYNIKTLNLFILQLNFFCIFLKVLKPIFKYQTIELHKL